MKNKMNYVAAVYEHLSMYDSRNTEINYILTKKNEDATLSFIAYAKVGNDQDELICVSNIPGLIEYSCFPQENYNIDYHLLDDLENGYELAYMSLDCHYDTWCYIHEIRDQVENSAGLQEYLCYCQKNNITPEAISSVLDENINIMNLYKEMNGNYEIIASTSIGNNAIVLAYNPNKKEYVTWRTTSNRKYGYDIGYYYSNYKDAFKNYQQRCNDMLGKHLCFEKKRIISKEKKIQER